MSGTLRATVIVPTYNRSDELRATLESLAAQDIPPDRFEVVVADDGSSDDTAAVAYAFSGRLTILYHFQEDLGSRAAAARNAGARLASAPILVFLDAGTLAGPGFVAGHVQEHERMEVGHACAVIGYTHGYRPFDPTPGLREAVATLSPAQVRATYGDSPSFQDCRHPEFASAGFDVEALPLPWIMFWSMNVSVPADAFWRVGGFDETYRGWGVEDLDLGLRLHRSGLRLVVGREAWAIETPHERDPSSHAETVTLNALQLLAKVPSPATEFNWSWFSTSAWLVEDNSAPLHAQYARFLAWRERARGVCVAAEVDAAVRDLAAGTRVAVFGCGDTVPDSLDDDALLIDFDDKALASIPDRSPGRRLHAIGLRTTLADGAVDVVVITSRLRGVWDELGGLIREEAARVGRLVVIAPALDDHSPSTVR